MRYQGEALEGIFGGEVVKGKAPESFFGEEG